MHDGGGVFDDLAGLEQGDTVEVLIDRRALDFTIRSDGERFRGNTVVVTRIR